jgi:hypothetical protein
MVNKMRKAVETLHSKPLADKNITVGFDGCCDVLVKPIRKIDTQTGGKTFFSAMKEFGEYIIDKQGKSCSIGFEEQSRRIGGNAPILANALGTLDIRTNVVGTLGYPEIEGVFSRMSEHCTLFSYDDSQTATALEFSDGKIIFSPQHIFGKKVWNNIKNIIGGSEVRRLFFETDVIALVNWSELNYATELWGDLYSEFELAAATDKQKYVFIDLADCSRNLAQDRIQIMEDIRRFSRFRKTVLSVNENEAEVLYRTFFQNEEHDYLKIGGELMKKFGFDLLIIHTRKESFTFTKKDIVQIPAFFVENPQISTGGGDNFNAGFILGLTLGADPETCSVLGNALSSYYITYGQSPDLLSLEKHLLDWAGTI